MSSSDEFGDSDNELIRISSRAIAARQSLSSLLRPPTGSRPTLDSTRSPLRRQPPLPSSSRDALHSQAPRRNQLPILRHTVHQASPAQLGSMKSSSLHRRPTRAELAHPPHLRNTLRSSIAPPHDSSLFYAPGPERALGGTPRPPSPRVDNLSGSSVSVLQDWVFPTPVSGSSSLSASSDLLASSASTARTPGPSRELVFPTPEAASSSSPSTPTKRRRVDHPDVYAARKDAKLRNPSSLKGQQLAERNIALDGVESLTALRNYDITEVSFAREKMILKWQCRCCHTVLAQKISVVSNLSKHLLRCRRLTQPLTADFSPWLPLRPSPPSSHDNSRLAILPAVAIDTVPGSAGQDAVVSSQVLSRPQDVAEGIRKIESKYSLLVRDEPAQLCLYAVWLDDNFVSKSVGLATFRSEGTQSGNTCATDVAGVIARFDIVRKWSGIVVARQTVKMERLVSGLRFAIESDDRMAAADRSRLTDNVRLVATLQHHLETILSSGGFGPLVNLCNRVGSDGDRVSEDHHPSGCPASSSIRSSSSSSGSDADSEEVDDDHFYPRLIHHRPGLMVDLWSTSAAIHPKTTSKDPMIHPTARFLRLVDQTMDDVRAGRIAWADHADVLDSWSLCIATKSDLDPAIYARLRDKIVHWRLLASEDALLRLVRFFREPPAASHSTGTQRVIEFGISLSRFTGESAEVYEEEIADLMTGRFHPGGQEPFGTLAAVVAWWVTHSGNLPRLARVAKTVLAIPAGVRAMDDGIK